MLEENAGHTVQSTGKNTGPEIIQVFFSSTFHSRLYLHPRMGVKVVAQTTTHTRRHVVLGGGSGLGQRREDQGLAKHGGGGVPGFFLSI